MSRPILEISTQTLAGAIRALRERLGALEGREITQEQMAKRIGAHVRAYVSWELGENIPRGEWLLAILQLCPDRQTLAAFGIECQTSNPRQPEVDPLEAEAREHYRQFREQALRLIHRALTLKGIDQEGIEQLTSMFPGEDASDEDLLAFLTGPVYHRLKQPIKEEVQSQQRPKQGRKRVSGGARR